SLSSTLPLIHFSSLAVHALHNAQSLFVGISNAISRDYRDLIHLQNDGWIVGPNGRLLLWVPPSYKAPLYTPWTHLIIPRGTLELDLSKMAHGPSWHQCYTTVPKYNTT
ncbi:hypothetical protein SCLCIDRAFT_1221589, partial [Scleroderma citrinum Foug A]